MLDRERRKRMRTPGGNTPNTSKKRRVQDKEFTPSIRRTRQPLTVDNAENAEPEFQKVLPPDHLKTNRIPEHTDSESDIEEELDYEALRLKNIEDNANFLSQLGILKAKQDLSNSAKKKPKDIRGLKQEKKKEKELLPRRASMRIRRIDPEGVPLPELPPPVQEYEHERKPSGPLQATEHMFSDKVKEEECLALLAHMQSMSRAQSKTKVKGNFRDLVTESYMDSLHDMKLTEKRVAKVVPSRIFSVAIHPSDVIVLAAAGGKWGQVGIWDVESDMGQNGVICFEPHSRPVSCLHFHPQNSAKLYSSSYDGTIRCLDVNKEAFDEIYATPDDDDIRVCGFSFLSPDTLVAAQSDGCVSVIDFRTPGCVAEQVYSCHYKLVKCVDVHPVERHYYASAGADSQVHLWDLRNMQKNSKRNPEPCATAPHEKSVDSAYFSPLSGKYLLTTSIDDRISVFDTSDIPGISKKVNVRHNNHTGRWLSNFRAVWHPSREDLFLSGSMARPRQIEMFNISGKIVKSFTDEEHLNSVCSLNAFHPTRNILVGGNSSGRIHVFL